MYVLSLSSNHDQVIKSESLQKKKEGNHHQLKCKKTPGTELTLALDRFWQL